MSVRLHHISTFILLLALCSHITFAAAPTITALIINTTLGQNTTSENITAYATSSDADGDPINISYDWRRDNVSIAVVNLDFDDENVTDRSTYANIYSGSGTYSFNTTAGPDGSKALRFAGSEGYFTPANRSSFNFSGSFTIELWASPISTRTATSQSVSGTAGTSGQRYALYPTRGDTTGISNAAGAGVSIGTNGVSVFEHDAAYLPSPLVDTTPISGWTHIVVVYRNNRPELYINGQFVRQGVQSSKAVVPPSQLGDDTGYGYYHGAIDNVRIYSDALGAPQIAALYSNSRTIAYDYNSPASWSVCATPNDATEEGDTTCANITITSGAPVISAVVLNTTSGTDTIFENLTAYVTTNDVNEDPVAVNYDWRINETSIAVLNLPLNYDYSGSTTDISTFGHTPTLSGPTYNSAGGHTGGAFEFDGIADTLMIPSHSLFSSSAGTWSFWVKHTGIWQGNGGSNGGSQGSAVIMTRASSSSSVSGITITSTTAGTISTQMKSGSATVAVLSGTISTSDNAWHHVAVVYNRSSGGENRLYVDGQLEDTANASAAWSFGTYPVYLADSTDTWWEEFNGTIDEVIISNRSFSSEQIEAIHNNRTDLVVSQELGNGESWSVCATPYDSFEEGTTSCSSNILLTDQVDSCTPETDTDWIIDAADNCLKTGQSIDLGTGILTISGAGYLRLVNTNITANDIIVGNGSGLTKIILEEGAQIILSS